MATPSDLDTAYADALRGDKGDVHLLRLIQKTGPVWSKLAPHTSKGLLAVFIKHVKVCFANESLAKHIQVHNCKQALLEARVLLLTNLTNAGGWHGYHTRKSASMWQSRFRAGVV